MGILRVQVHIERQDALSPGNYLIQDSWRPEGLPVPRFPDSGNFHALEYYRTQGSLAVRNSGIVENSRPRTDRGLAVFHPVRGMQESWDGLSAFVVETLVYLESKGCSSPRNA
jgi:hypothetical protein